MVEDDVRVDLPVICDAKELLRALAAALKERGCTPEKPWCCRAEGWRERSLRRLALLPPVTGAMKEPQADGKGNIYRFYDCLSELLPEQSTLLVSVGTSRVAGTQAFRVKEGGRFYTNSATASMGYGLPASIGLAAALLEKKERASLLEGEGTPEPGALSSCDGICEGITAVNGEGCMMMNLQELQTIATNQLPIRVIVICNGGYHSLRQTQRAYFGEPLLGVGPESGDLGFPPLEKLADTFGFSYGSCLANETMMEDLEAALMLPLPAMIEVQVSPLQGTEPKAAFRKREDGSSVTLPLEDMAPHLPREVLRRELEVPMTSDESW